MLIVNIFESQLLWRLCKYSEELRPSFFYIRKHANTQTHKLIFRISYSSLKVTQKAQSNERSKISICGFAGEWNDDPPKKV